MTFSMTGYGKTMVQIDGRVLTVEIRTLNSKQGDLNVRIPSLYREKEMEIRDLISVKLGRGKIDLTVQRDLADGESMTQLNPTLVKNYYNQLKRIAGDLQGDEQTTAVEYLDLILKMPDVMKPASEDLEEKEYEALKGALEACIEKVNEFRAQEGEKLEVVLADGANTILHLLEQVEPLEGERTEKIKKRITNNLDDNDQSAFDQDRFEQELIYYLEKLDISEEKVRLRAHIEYFHKTLQDQEAKGKKLSFIAQEMGREINTLGSKAQHPQIQRFVVEMKDELEKIKEQVLNVL